MSSLVQFSPATYLGRPLPPPPPGAPATPGKAESHGGILVARLLLIGDTPAMAVAVQRALGDGFTLDTSPPDFRARDKAWGGRYDVLLLDLAGPDRAGLALLHEWRRAGLDVPVLALAEPGRPDDRVCFLEGGADDCLTLPSQGYELAPRLRALVRRRARGDGPPVRVGGLEIDPVSHTVRRGGRLIRLTPREYALLRVLAANRGRVVARSVIRDALYGDGAGKPSSNVVDVYVRYLRRKIDRGFFPPLILTRWGQGYLLRAE
jgi:DNA-binding response OmpR family regulator